MVDISSKKSISRTTDTLHSNRCPCHHRLVDWSLRAIRLAVQGREKVTRWQFHPKHRLNTACKYWVDRKRTQETQTGRREAIGLGQVTNFRKIEHGYGKDQSKFQQRKAREGI